MAASLTILTGQPNAAPKSNPTHPHPKLYGSAIGRPRRTGPGYPIDTRSYIQSPASFLTPETIRLGVSVGPDKNDRRSLCPVARILTELPPTSTASTALTEDFIATSSCRTVPFSTASSDQARTALARSLENVTFGSN